MFEVLPLPFQRFLIGLIIITLVMIILNLFVFAAMLTKVNKWWGGAPSKMETSLKIVGLLLLFDLGLGIVKILLKLVVFNSVFSAILGIVGFVLYFVFFVFLMSRIYQTDYWNGLKIAVVSKFLTGLIIGIIGGGITLLYYLGGFLVLLFTGAPL